MSQRDELIFLHDMLDHARFALEFVEGRSRDDILEDRQLAFAVVRALEVVGEAAARVPQTIRTNYPAIEWRQIVGMRNILIHGYTRVDYELLWEITIERLPPLIDQLQDILKREEGQYES